jgi:hypothetical protein
MKRITAPFRAQPKMSPGRSKQRVSTVALIKHSRLRNFKQISSMSARLNFWRGAFVLPFAGHGGDMTNQASSTESAKQDPPSGFRRDATPTLFADGLLGGSVEAGVVRLELLARHFDPESKSLSPALVGRIVMPQANLATFVAALVELVKQTTTSKEKNS